MSHAATTPVAVTVAEVFNGSEIFRRPLFIRLSWGRDALTDLIAARAARVEYYEQLLRGAGGLAAAGEFFARSVERCKAERDLLQQIRDCSIFSRFAWRALP